MDKTSTDALNVNSHMLKGSFKANKGIRTPEEPDTVSAGAMAPVDGIGHVQGVRRQSTLELALATPLEPLDSDDDATALLKAEENAKERARTGPMSLIVDDELDALRRHIFCDFTEVGVPYRDAILREKTQQYGAAAGTAMCWRNGIECFEGPLTHECLLSHGHHCPLGGRAVRNPSWWTCCQPPLLSADEWHRLARGQMDVPARNSPYHPHPGAVVTPACATVAELFSRFDGQHLLDGLSSLRVALLWMRRHAMRVILFSDPGRHISLSGEESLRARMLCFRLTVKLPTSVAKRIWEYLCQSAAKDFVEATATACRFFAQGNCWYGDECRFAHR